MKNIIVAGSSLAGLMVVKALRRHGCQAAITMLAPRAEMFYYPAIIWVPVKLYKKSDLTFPLNNFLQRYDVDYLAGSVIGLDASMLRLRTTAGEIEYDRLVIATGGSSPKQLPGIENVFIPCDGYDQVSTMMARLDSLDTGTLAFGFSGNLDEPTAIRAEPLLEFLFGIDTLLRRRKCREHFDLVFFTSCHQPDTRWGEAAMGHIKRELDRRGIRAHIGHKINGFGPDRVMTDGGEIKSDLSVFIPEMIGPHWARNSDLPLSVDGFIRTDTHCRVIGFEGNVYGAGDACHFSGPDWVPKQAHMADLHGETLARNLIGDLRGERLVHTFRQEFICIMDTLDGGILVFRNLERNLVLKNRMLHWAKRLFIWMYLREYRNSKQHNN